MKEKFDNRAYLIGLILFVATIILNYMSAAGIILPYSQKEISDLYQNLLTPASSTFSIWGIIYIGMGLSFALPFIKRLKNDEKNIYYGLIMRGFIIWEVFNIIWTLTWNSDITSIALIAIVLYSLSLFALVKKISKYRVFSKKYKVYLTIPLGLHTGWLIFASFTNVMVFFVKIGLNPYGVLGIILTILMMAIALILVLFAFKKTGNAYITPPALWALGGIALKQSQALVFSLANTLVLVFAILFIIGGLAAHIIILKNRK